MHKKKNSVSTVNAEEGEIKMEGRYCQGAAHARTHTPYCADEEACLHRGARKACGRPAGPCETWKGCNESFSRNITSTFALRIIQLDNKHSD